MQCGPPHNFSCLNRLLRPGLSLSQLCSSFVFDHTNYTQFVFDCTQYNQVLILQSKVLAIHTHLEIRISSKYSACKASFPGTDVSSLLYRMCLYKHVAEAEVFIKGIFFSKLLELMETACKHAIEGRWDGSNCCQKHGRY